jgi:ribosome maturation factor RimP
MDLAPLQRLSSDHPDAAATVGDSLAQRIAALAAELPRIGEEAGPASSVAVDLRDILESLGFRLVRLYWQNAAGKAMPVLQVMAEPLSGLPMSVEGCAEISTALSAYLDVQDTVKVAYRLEVSSPGLDRPLTALIDFARWQGFEAKLESQFLIDGQKRFRGLLLGVNELGEVGLALDGREIWLDARQLAKARLLASDALFEAAKRGTLPPPVHFDLDAEEA